MTWPEAFLGALPWVSICGLAAFVGWLDQKDGK